MKIIIAKDFSTSPGPRLIAEGDFSGEEFRKLTLLPKLKEAISKGKILTVDLDGTSGYGTSFLEESFGGLIRTNDYSLKDLEKHLLIKSEEVPDWLEEIKEYMHDASNEKGKTR